MKITLALLADYANVSREGKLNIMGVFDQIRAKRVPARHPQMQLVLRLEVSPEEIAREHAIEIQCMDADGNRVFTLSGSFVLQAQSPAQRPTALRIDHIIGFTDVTFAKFGGHTFSVFIDNDLKAQVPLELAEIHEDLQLPGI